MPPPWRLRSLRPTLPRPQLRLGRVGSIDIAFRKIRKRADAMYKADGGRDVAIGNHRRTHDQRMYDAAMEHLGQAQSDSGTASSTAGASPDAAPTTPVRANRADDRPTMVFVAKLSDITDDRGQWIALTIRDGGCTLCGADPSHCQAHHLKPWNAPVKGETNIDELAMVCTDCHHRLHDNKQTLFYDTKLRKWRLRAATPDEIPPERPRSQFDANTIASRSSEPSGSRPADSSTSVKAT